MTVPYFRKYVVKKQVKLINNENQEPAPKPYNHEDLISSLNLGEDASAWDRRLLYEVTGLRFDEDDYRDESSDDEFNSDPSAFLLRTVSMRDTMFIPEKSDQFVPGVQNDSDDDEDKKKGHSSQSNGTDKLLTPFITNSELNRGENQ